MVVRSARRGKAGARRSVRGGAPLDAAGCEEASRICYAHPFDGFDAEHWPEMIDWLCRHFVKLEEAFSKPLGRLSQELKSEAATERARRTLPSRARTRDLMFRLGCVRRRVQNGCICRVTEPSRNGVDESRATTNNPEVRLDGISPRVSPTAVSGGADACGHCRQSPAESRERVMIPELITKAHVLEAIRRIERDGIPPRRRSRGYCVVADGKHLPPKYVIALAHEAATGEFPSSEVFSGGTESNEFLGRRGFEVVECSCGGGVHDGGGTRGSVSTKGRRRPVATTRHSERCPECKRRVRALLERIYGNCLPNHGFRWRTDLTAYAGTSIDATLRNVAAVLESYRGFGIGEFVRRATLAPCDFWVPNPGFVVEFDESQHFTKPRKLALSVYADTQSLGFSAMRWMERCDAHDAKDNDPPYRDEQRAWYDTLRDLVPRPRRGGRR